MTTQNEMPAEEVVMDEDPPTFAESLQTAREVFDQCRLSTQAAITGKDTADAAVETAQNRLDQARESKTVVTTTLSEAYAAEREASDAIITLHREYQATLP